MGTEFEDSLSDIAGGGAAAAPEVSQEQAQAAPAQSNAFDECLAEIQASSPADMSPSHDMPEPGGGRER